MGRGSRFWVRFVDAVYGGCDAVTDILVVGLCLAEQLLAMGQEVPTTNSDWIVDALAVGDGRLLTLDD